MLAQTMGARSCKRDAKVVPSRAHVAPDGANLVVEREGDGLGAAEAAHEAVERRAGARGGRAHGDRAPSPGCVSPPPRRSLWADRARARGHRARRRACTVAAATATATGGSARSRACTGGS